MNEDYLIGICEDMCPASEIAMRKKNRLVHFFEKTELVKVRYECFERNKNVKPAL